MSENQQPFVEPEPLSGDDPNEGGQKPFTTMKYADVECEFAFSEDLPKIVQRNYQKYQTMWQRWCAKGLHKSLGLPHPKKGSSFNGAAFFLGAIWLTYRKLYKHAIIYVIAGLLLGVIQELVSTTISISLPPLGIIVWASYAVMSNSIYLKHCSKIYQNGQELNSEDSSNAYYKKKGGVSLIGSFIVAILMVVSITVGVILTFDGGFNDIDIIKGSYLYINEDSNIDEVMKAYPYFRDQEWKSFEAENGRRVIEFKATYLSPLFDPQNENVKYYMRFVINDDQTEFYVEQSGLIVNGTERPYSNELTTKMLTDIFTYK